MNFIKSLKAFCGVFIIKSKNRQILFTMKKTWKILLIIVGCFSVLTAGGSIYYAAVTKDAVLDENKLLLSDGKKRRGVFLARNFSARFPGSESEIRLRGHRGQGLLQPPRLRLQAHGEGHLEKRQGALF